MRYASIITRTGLITALSMAAFMACKKEKEQNGPSIIIPNETGVIAGDQTVPPGTHTVRFKLVFQKGSGKDDADLKDFSFTFNAGAGNQTVFANRPAPNGSSFTFDTTLDITGTAGQTYTYTFSVRDKNDKSASKSFKITFRDTATSPQGTLLTGQITLDTTNAFIYISPNGIERRNLAGVQAGDAAYVVAALIVRSSSPQTYSLVTPDSLGKGNYTNNPNINWTANPKPTTIFYQADAQLYAQVTDSAALRNLSWSSLSRTKYINNGDGARATLHTDDNMPQNTSGPHEYLAFQQQLSSSNIWGVLRRVNAGNKQVVVEIKAIRFQQ